MKKGMIFIILVLVSTVLLYALPPEEGMYPMSEIYKLDLQAKGLELKTSDLFNPDGISLIDGILWGHPEGQHPGKRLPAKRIHR